MAQGSSYRTTCISIVRLNFPKSCECRKCGTVWCYYNIVTMWRNPKNIRVHALYVQTTETYILSPRQDTAVHIHPKQYKRGTCLYFIYWNLYCPHAVIVFLGDGVNSSASVNSNLLQAKIPNTVNPPAWTRPISSVFVVSNLTALPKAALHNPKSYELKLPYTTKLSKPHSFLRNQDLPPSQKKNPRRLWWDPIKSQCDELGLLLLGFSTKFCIYFLSV
jgi:hypothetical protein